MGNVTRRTALAGLVATIVFGVVGCASSTDDDAATTTTIAVDEARSAFCADLADHVEVLDRYGRVFTDEELTVGDLQSAAEDLGETRTAVEGSAGTLAEAIEATNQAADAEGSTTTTVLASKSADDHLEAIEKAQKELDRTIEGIDASTAVTSATAELHAAAFGVEQAYVSLFVDAGCLEEDARAAQALNRYTTALQEDLTTLGYYTAPVDGLYGPATLTAIEALQASEGLPQTGIVDPTTEAALDEQLAAKGQQESQSIAALQGALTVAGFYTGPIDGTWTPALEDALKAFQTDQDLPATGAVDPATLAALLDLSLIHI